MRTTRRTHQGFPRAACLALATTALMTPARSAAQAPAADGLYAAIYSAKGRILARLESLTPAQAEIIRQMSLDAPIDFLRRVGRMIVRWKGAGPLDCPVHAIHGARDHIIPMNRLRPDEVIPEGGHLINLTHAPRVNAFIRHFLCTTETRKPRREKEPLVEDRR